MADDTPDPDTPDYDLSDPAQWPDHWSETGAPQETLREEDGPDNGLVRVLSDDADTEEVHYPDGTFTTRPRTVLDVPDLPDPTDAPAGMLGATQWVNANLPRRPLWTPNQAVAQARLQVTRDTCPHYGNYGGLCLHFTACMYGFASSGTYDAASFWRLMPSKYRHPGDHSPPVGALVCWYGGSSGHGHISIVVNPGMIASNDINSYGRISVVPLSSISSRWGQSYQGWCPPYFARGNGTNGQTPQVAAHVGGQPKPSPWERGPVYVQKLHRGQRNSDSVRRLKYRLRHHADVPTHFKNDMQMSGDYGPGTEAAVQWWQHNVDDTKAAGPRNGEEVSNRQANRLFGENYRVIEHNPERHGKGGKR